jgi:hypothetical protein
VIPVSHQLGVMQLLQLAHELFGSARSHVTAPVDGAPPAALN